MNNEIDLLDELEREEREERLATGGGGAGAALGVLLTLLIGCGLVFSAYKLGQRKTVDGPPLITASADPVKIVPENPGGSVIPNTDNLANAMVDGTRPTTTGYGVNGTSVVAEEVLPVRDIDQTATSANARDAMREVTQLDNLPLKNELDGEPMLVVDGVPDRTAEQMLVDGAEIAPATQDIFAQGQVPSARATLDGMIATTPIGVDGTTPGGPALAPQEGVVYTNTANAVNGTSGTVSTTPLGTATAQAAAPVPATAQVFAQQGTETPPLTSGLKSGLTMRMPTRKPRDIGLSAGLNDTDASAQARALREQQAREAVAAQQARDAAAAEQAQRLQAENRTPALAPVTRPAPSRIQRAPQTPLVEPAIARMNTLPPAQPRQAQPLSAPNVQAPPAVRRVRIPEQPLGDAQVELGAFGSPEEVRGRWGAIQGRNTDLLGRLGLQVLPVRIADGRELFRMRVGPLRDTQQAAQLCQALEGRGIDCFVPRR